MADSTTNLGFTLPRYRVVGNNSGFPTQVEVGTEGSLTYPLYSLDYEYAPPWFSFQQANAIQDLKRAMVPSTVEGMTPYSAGNWMNVQPIANYSQQFGILTPGQGTNLGFPGWYSNAQDIPGAGSGSSGGNQQYANVTPFTPSLNGATTNVDLQALWAQFQDSLGAPNQNSPRPLDLSNVPGVGATSTPTPVSGVNNLGLTTAPTIGEPPLPQQPTIGTPPLPEYPGVAGPPAPATPVTPTPVVINPIPGGYDPNTGAIDVGPGITGTPTGTAPEGLPAQVADWLKGVMPYSQMSAEQLRQQASSAVPWWDSMSADQQQRYLDRLVASPHGRWAYIADYPTDLDSIVRMLDANESYAPFGAAVKYNAGQIRSLLQAGVPLSMGYSTFVVPDGQGGYRWVAADLWRDPNEYSDQYRATSPNQQNYLWNQLPQESRNAMAQAINSIAPTFHTQYYGKQAPLYNG